MTINLPLSVRKEFQGDTVLWELFLGRQVVASATLTRGTSDARALRTLLDELPR